MRRFLLTLTIAAAGITLARPVSAQGLVKFGVQGAMQTSLAEASALDGSFGAGARVALQPPALPIGLVGQGVYYFPDCDDCSYLTYSIAAQLRLPLPVFSPYAIGGWQFRRTAQAGESDIADGAMVGAGIQLNLGISLFLEGTYEFTDLPEGVPDFDNDPIVIKGGILLG
ncbi:MAG: hypothetical protein PVJ80_06110 [Gemmatimonadota bacterium]|jgi:hypothetical protein